MTHGVDAPVSNTSPEVSGKDIRHRSVGRTTHAGPILTHLHTQHRNTSTYMYITLYVYIV